MEPSGGRLRTQLRRRLSSIAAYLMRLLVMLTPQAKEGRAQRICPFCGLITSRHRKCLECGKSLKMA